MAINQVPQRLIIYSLLTLVLVTASFISISYSAPIYTPGQTLNPACTPGMVDCTVTTPVTAGANSNITSLSGLTTALSIAQGGTGATSAGAARTALSAAASGSNSDITGLTALTTINSAATTTWTISGGSGLIFNDGLANTLTVDSDGHLKLLEVEYDDLRIAGEQLGSGASAPDRISWVVASMNEYGFDGNATSEQLFFTVQLPHGYKEGTDIMPHVHWGPTTAGAGDVKWFLDYTWVNVNDTFPVPTTISVVDAADGVQWKHQIIGLGTISGTGKKISSLLVGRIYRNPSDAADTYTADAALLELDFHYQIDSLGSKQEYIK